MAIFDNNGVQLSPCICSKARYALRLKSSIPKNNQTCILPYWKRVVRRVAELELQENKHERIEQAINMYHELNKR